MTLHGLARSSTQLGSILGSVWLKVQLSSRLGLARPGSASRSNSARGSAYWSSGLVHLGSARLGTAGYSDSTHLDSWLRLDLGLRIWARESTRCLARFSSELGSGSARVWTRDSRLRIRLDLARGSAQLIGNGVYIGRSRLSSSRLTFFYIKETIHRRKGARQKRPE